jgi:DNA-directed RNA polymerase subunit RPC12/RpoP
MADISCPGCGSPALVYPAVLEDDQPVACANCGMFVFTYGDLKRRSQLVGSNPRRPPVSGC